MFDDSKFIKPQMAHQQLPNYLASPSSIVGIENLYAEIVKPNFYLKDIGITARVLAHWKENELLPPSKSEDLGWNRFDFAEYIWIRIIQDLRKFGMSLPKIKKVKEYLLAGIDTNVNRPTQQEILDFKEQGLNLTELSEDEKEQLVAMLSENSGFEAMKSFVSHHRKIEMMVFTSIIYRLKIGILIGKDGLISDWMGVDNESYENAYSRTELFISISDIIFEFMNDETKEKYLLPLKLMTELELKVLRAIRRNDLKEVIIKFPIGSKREDKKMITVKEVQFTEQQKEILYNILGKREYMNISIKTNSGGQLYVESSQQTNL